MTLGPSSIPSSFNPRSSRSRGATARPRRSPGRSGFNPRSSRSRGATGGVLHLHLQLVVSTHAPRGHEERLFGISQTQYGKWFQPTLLAVTRSDDVGVPHPARRQVSTHAPRGHEERHLVMRPPKAFIPVSTHAPRGHEERLKALEIVDSMGGFQPTLLAVTRSDRRRGCRAESSQVSTHAPRGHEERLSLANPPAHDAAVSTHAPRGHEERQSPGHPYTTVAKFQPTLLAVTRSDLRARLRPARGASSFNPRSSRSRGATSNVRSCMMCSCFNPRSSRSRGATETLAMLRNDEAVSTHAPRGHEERPDARVQRQQEHLFQPTLLAVTRSDPTAGAWTPAR